MLEGVLSNVLTSLELGDQCWKKSQNDASKDMVGTSCQEFSHHSPSRAWPQILLPV
jgi:hypothetical protein